MEFSNPATQGRDTRTRDGFCELGFQNEELYFILCFVRSVFSRRLENWRVIMQLLIIVDKKYHLGPRLLSPSPFLLGIYRNIASHQEGCM